MTASLITDRLHYLFTSAAWIYRKVVLYLFDCLLMVTSLVWFCFCSQSSSHHRSLIFNAYRCSFTFDSLFGVCTSADITQIVFNVIIFSGVLFVQKFRSLEIHPHVGRLFGNMLLADFFDIPLQEWYIFLIYPSRSAFQIKFFVLIFWFFDVVIIVFIWVNVAVLIKMEISSGSVTFSSLIVVCVWMYCW